MKNTNYQKLHKQKHHHHRHNHQQNHKHKNQKHKHKQKRKHKMLSNLTHRTQYCFTALSQLINQRLPLIDP